MSRIFKINIILKKDIEKDEVLYEGICGNEYRSNDKLRISTHNISLECKRSNDKDLSRLLSDFKSTINLQIAKSISFFIAVKGFIPEIENIYITKYKEGNLLLDEYKSKDIIQPFEGRLPTAMIFNKDDLNVLFESNEKAKSILVSLTFLIKAFDKIKPGESFDKLWTSFNSLYTYVTQEDIEIEKHRKMRTFIINHENLFQRTCSIFDSFDQKKIRELQWRNLILNDYNTEKKCGAFKDFVKRYSDYRINQVFNEILCFRKDHLQKNNFLIETTDHIRDCITNGEKKNVEVLTLYLIKYSYFIRNKYFHGEKINTTFNLIENDDIKELGLLNIILSTFLKELISSNSHY